MTFVSEVAGMMNGRPLTQVSSDSRYMEPITPNQFLLGPHHQIFHPEFSWISQLLSPAVVSKHNTFPISFGIVFWKNTCLRSSSVAIGLCNSKYAAWRHGLSSRTFYTTWVMAICKSRQSVSGGGWSRAILLTQNDLWLNSETSHKVVKNFCRLRKQNLKLRLSFTCVNCSTWTMISIFVQTLFRGRSMLWLNILIEWISLIVIHTWNLLINFQFLIIRITHCKFSWKKLFKK